jgi:hypothetical protein
MWKGPKVPLETRIAALSPKDADVMRHFISQNEATQELVLENLECRTAVDRKKRAVLREQVSLFIRRLHT